jgi:hypothetical protein
MVYQCSICGKTHDNLPDISTDSPWQYLRIPENERGQRVFLNSDLCVIDEKDFFIRSVIEIPLIDAPRSFAYGVWVSLKKENFLSYVHYPDADDIGPFFGWLCTRLSVYSQDTLNLKSMVHFQGNGLRPYIELEEINHPLCVEQKRGIDFKRAWEIMHYYVPGTGIS